MTQPAHLQDEKPQKGRRGILGIVVSGVLLIAVLVALFIVGMRTYLTVLPTAEAANTIGDITAHVVAHYQETRTLCPSASRPVPASTGSITGMKYLAPPAEWTVDAPRSAGFACLKFVASEPRYYQYDYQSDGRSFTITARGDLDGDGKLAVFTQTGRIEDERVVLDPLRSPLLEQ